MKWVSHPYSDGEVLLTALFFLFSLNLPRNKIVTLTILFSTRIASAASLAEVGEKTPRRALEVSVRPTRYLNGLKNVSVLLLQSAW
jgi:hypothetical protein